MKTPNGTNGSTRTTGTKPSPAFSWDDIREAAGLAYTDVPDGAINVQQYAARYHMAEKGAWNQLQALVRRGVLQSARGRRPGDRRPMTYYWPK